MPSVIINTAGNMRAIPKASRKVTNNTKKNINTNFIFFSKTKSFIMFVMRLKTVIIYKKFYLYLINLMNLVYNSKINSLQF